VPTEDVAGWVVRIGARMSPSSTFGVLELLHEGRTLRQRISAGLARHGPIAGLFGCVQGDNIGSIWLRCPVRAVVLVWGRDWEPG
jgi:hypothetical protein